MWTLSTPYVKAKEGVPVVAATTASHSYFGRQETCACLETRTRVDQAPPYTVSLLDKQSRVKMKNICWDGNEQRKRLLLMAESGTKKTQMPSATG